MAKGRPSLTYTPLAFERVEHYGPEGSPADAGLTQMFPPGPPVVTTGRLSSRRGGGRRAKFGRSVSEKKELRRERRDRSRLDRRRGDGGDGGNDAKENMGRNSRPPRAGDASDSDEVISSPEKELDVEAKGDDDEMKMEEEDAMELDDDADFGGTTEFHVESDAENNDDDDEEATAIGEEGGGDDGGFSSDEDGDPSMVRKRLFHSTSKKLETGEKKRRRVIREEEEGEEESSRESVAPDADSWEDTSSEPKPKRARGAAGREKKSKDAARKLGGSLEDSSDDEDASAKKDTSRAKSKGGDGARKKKGTSKTNSRDKDEPGLDLDSWSGDESKSEDRRRSKRLEEVKHDFAAVKSTVSSDEDSENEFSVTSDDEKPRKKKGGRPAKVSKGKAKSDAGNMMDVDSDEDEASTCGNKENAKSASNRKGRSKVSKSKKAKQDDGKSLPKGKNAAMKAKAVDGMPSDAKTKAAKSTKADKANTSKPSHARKSGIDFVKAAAARMDAASAEKKLAEEKEKAGKEELKRAEQAQKKKAREEKRKRRDELEFEEEASDGEEEDTSVDDDASEYQPTQGDGGRKNAVVERSPRPTRRSSSRIKVGKKKAGEAQPSEEAVTAPAPRRRKKAEKSKKTRGAKGLELEDDALIPADLDVCSEDTTKTCGGKKTKSSKSNNGRKEKSKSTELKDPSVGEEAGKVRTKMATSRGKTCLDEETLGGDDGGDKVVAAKTRSRGKRSKASESNNGKTKNGDFEGDEASRGKSGKSTSAKPAKADSRKEKNEEDAAMELESLNVDCSNSLYDDNLEIEYHREEDEDDGTIYTRNMLPMTQAMFLSDQGSAKFSQDSSNAGLEHDNHNHASTRVAKGGGADPDAAKKFIELNTRDVFVSKMGMSQFDQSFAGSNAAEDESASAKTHKSHGVGREPKRNCLELTTRGLSGLDPETLLTQAQTTQQSSTISPETIPTLSCLPQGKASMMDNDYDLQRNGRAASLGGTENSATSNPQSKMNGETQREKMRPEEIQALQNRLQDITGQLAEITQLLRRHVN